jgi:NADPH-dependent F420 reductase
MKIAILGTGRIGGALARLWQGHGHEIALVARNEERAQSLRNDFPRCRVIRASACAKAEVVALCMPWNAAESALQSVSGLDGKVLIDCTNPLNADASGLILDGTASAAEQIQEWAPKAKVVKAFNSLGAALLGNADFAGVPADGFYCGDDAEAKRLVAVLVQDAGLHPVDVGPLKSARCLEPLAMLWIDLALHQKRGGNFAFKLISRERG